MEVERPERRFKLEFLNTPRSKPFWFSTREEVDAFVALIKGCPTNDGPAQLRITEFGVTKVERL